MNRETMKRVALGPDEGWTAWELTKALNDALQELNEVGAALETAKTGEALVAVALDAHKAELEHAADKELLGRMRTALGVHAICTVFCCGCGGHYKECHVCGATISDNGVRVDPVQCSGHEVKGHRAGCLLEG